MNLRETSKLLYLLKLASQEMTGVFEKETGFSITRYELMMFLRETKECSQTMIQSELKIDSAAVTRHLKILEEKGYVVRERSPENNRIIIVQITDKAKQELDACSAKHNSTDDKINTLLTSDEEQQLLKLLTKMVK